MINFAELQENVTSCLENQKIMSAQLLKLEQTVATLSTKAEVETMELRFQEELSKTLRAIERVDLAQSAASKVVEEMPSIQRDLMGRMTDLESRAAEHCPASKAGDLIDPIRAGGRAAPLSVARRRAALPPRAAGRHAAPPPDD